MDILIYLSVSGAPPLFIQSIFGRPGMDLTKQLRPTARAPHFGRFFHH